MKTILFNSEDGTYIVEKTLGGSFPFENNKVYWDEQNILVMYSNNEKDSIRKLKDYAIKYHQACIEKLNK